MDHNLAWGFLALLRRRILLFLDNDENSALSDHEQMYSWDKCTGRFFHTSYKGQFCNFRAAPFFPSSAPPPRGFQYLRIPKNSNPISSPQFLLLGAFFLQFLVMALLQCSHRCYQNWHTSSNSLSSPPPISNNPALSVYALVTWGSHFVTVVS